MQTERTPQTLLEAIRHFADLDVATTFVAKLRWPDGFVCPACGCKKFSYLKTRRLWKCSKCKKQTSVKKGTIFEDSPIGLDKWLAAMWLVLNCKNGISSYELARDLGIHQQSAWFVLHRIRLAMETGSFTNLSGEIELDESYVGGKAANMHKARRAKHRGGRGVTVNKTPVMGMLERDGKVVAKVVRNTRKLALHREIRRHVEPGSSLYSDSFDSYTGLEGDYDHKVVDHARAYVEGRVHVQGMENFWSLLKRSLKGTYVAVEPEHLNAYVAEQVWRFNEREGTDANRLATALGRVEGRRITYRQLTKKAPTES